MNVIEIKNGWWFAAGNIFRWTKTAENYHVFGVGIAVDKFSESEIFIRIAGQLYRLDSKKGLEFALRFKSFKMIQGRKIAVVSKSLLEMI